jgi:hypothetical protein
MAPGSTRSLAEMSAKNPPWGEGRKGLIASPPRVSRLPRNCGSLDISQRYGPSWPLTGIALPLPRTI